MRTIESSRSAVDLAEIDRVRAMALTARIVGGLHDVIGGFRCAGTGRLVKLGISMTHMHVLWLLQHHGDLPMSRMADLMDVSLSNATGIIDRMEERQLVERVRVRDDRRIVLVRIAEGGLRALDEIEALRQDRLQAILSHLDNRQLARLAQSFDDVRGAIAAEGGLDHEHVPHVHPEQSPGRD
jgi:DNA-binding MarR family transcriptional regulator